MPCAQPSRNFWEVYRLFNIHDAKFDGVYFPGVLQQAPKVALRCSVLPKGIADVHVAA